MSSVIDTVTVKVSVASLLQRFHGCEPVYIRDVCRGRCCDAPGRPSGTMVTIHPSEADAIRACGGEIDNGLLVTSDRVCTFKTPDHLCELHGTRDKPFGCIASPFTLNKNDVLIVRNRYRMLPCYSTTAERSWGKDPAKQWPHAYVAFSIPLEHIFGHDEYRYLADQMDRRSRWGIGPDRLEARMPERSYRMLKDNDQIKRDNA